MKKYQGWGTVQTVSGQRASAESEGERGVSSAGQALGGEGRRRETD